MTANELNVFRTRLVTMLTTLESTLEQSAEAADTVVLDQSSVGRLSRMDALQAQAMAQETLRRNHELKRHLHAALGRLDNDDFGFCEDCGEAISPRRLACNPVVDCCIACAELREKPKIS